MKRYLHFLLIIIWFLKPPASTLSQTQTSAGDSLYAVYLLSVIAPQPADRPLCSGLRPPARRNDIYSRNIRPGFCRETATLPTRNRLYDICRNRTRPCPYCGKKTIYLGRVLPTTDRTALSQRENRRIPFPLTLFQRLDRK